MSICYTVITVQKTNKITTITLGIAIFFITTLGWYQGSGEMLGNSPTDTAIALARLSGLLGMLALLFQVVLIGRIRFIERLWGHDTMNTLHRGLGYGIIVFFIAHIVGMYYGYGSDTTNTFIQQTQSFITNWDDVGNAILGFILFFIALFLSLPWVRKLLKYETWYFSHLVMYAAIALVFGHQTESGDLLQSPLFLGFWNAIVYGVLACMVIYRFIIPLVRMYTIGFRVERIVQENENVHSIYITGKYMNRFVFDAGQFVHVRFFAKHFWKESHPFSLSVGPNGSYIRLSVKESGDFTKMIKNIPLGTRVLVDGPLGHFTLRNARKMNYLFIAGGIGITPIRSLAQTVAHTKGTMQLLWAVTKESDLALYNELQGLVQNITIFVSEGAQTNGFRSGRITKEALQELAPDYLERDVYLCGPPKMMETVRKQLHELGLPKSQIHFEKFSY